MNNLEFAFGLIVTFNVGETVRQGYITGLLLGQQNHLHLIYGLELFEVVD